MSFVWKPKQDPPKLDKYCHLSHDAQKVMLALYGDYLQRRAEVLETKSIISDPKNYYKSIYEAKFSRKSEAVSVCHQATLGNPYLQNQTKRQILTPNTSNSGQYHERKKSDHLTSRRLEFNHTKKSHNGSTSKTSTESTIGISSCLQTKNRDDSGKSYSKDISCSPDASNYSDSPPVETQDFRILTQLQREDILVTSKSHDEIAPHGLLESIEARINDSTETVKSSDRDDCYGVVCKSNQPVSSDRNSDFTNVMPDECSNKIRKISICDANSGTTDAVFSDSQSLFSQDLQTYTEPKKQYRNSERKLAQKHCVTLQKSYISSENTFGLKTSSEMLNKSNESIDNTSERSDNTEQQNYISVNSQPEPFVFKPVSSDDIEGKSYVADSHDRHLYLKNQQQYTALETCVLEDEKPTVRLKLANKTSKGELQDKTKKTEDEVDLPENPCADNTGKLFPIFAKTACSNMKLTRNSKTGDQAMKRPNSSQSFDVPFKKKKNKDNHSSSRVVEVQYTQSNLIYLKDLHLRELSVVLSNFLNSEEVIVVLVYMDTSTQLRSSLFGQETKKRPSSKQKQSFTNVSGVALGTKSDNYKKVYIFPESVSEAGTLSMLRSFWEDLFGNQVKKVGFEIKSLLVELTKIYNFDSSTVATKWCIQDVAIGVWLLDPDKPVTTFEQTLAYLHLPPQTPCDCSMKALSSDMLLLSTAMDKLYLKVCILATDVHMELRKQELLDLFLQVECRLTPLLAVMELRELHVASHTLLMFSELLKKKLQKLEDQAHQAAGHPFLLNSHAQLRQVLFETLRLDTLLPNKAKLAKTTVGKETSTSESVLHQLSPHHPLPNIVLEYRQLQKLKSTYIDGMLSCVYDGKLQTHWDQTAAATGRLTSFQPNVQAIPKAPVTFTDYKDSFITGKSCNEETVIFARDCFVSRPGYSLMAADFQQIELRLLGHLTKDPVLIKIFNDLNVPDIFNALTAEWLGKPVDTIITSEREQTKRVVYSVMYGVGKDKLAEYLKISPTNAKAIMNSFLIKFPAVNQFTKACVDYCQRHGYTRTIFKRKRLFPNIRHTSYALRAQAERQCVNFCVQGSAADLCKAAMLQVEYALAQRPQLNARQLVQIHDELLYEVADADLAAVTGLVTEVMESCDKLCEFMPILSVPIAVSVSVGKTWGHMEAATQAENT